jgi:alpha-glucosidase
MIDAHEPIKATGKTNIPNMMTREGARGMEWNGWSSGTPDHHTILPLQEV